MKKKILAMLLCLTMILAVGCNSGESGEKTVTDRQGNEVAIPSEIETIISTAPANTENLVALGLADKIIAADEYSADVEGLSESTELMNFTTPDAEAIIELDPDIIVATEYSGSSEDPYKAVKDAGICVVYIPSSNSIEAIYEDITFLAEVFDVTDKGEEIISSMKSDIDEIKEIGSKITDKKKVYFEIGPAPNLYSFGNSTFLNEFIEIVGAENIFKDQESWISPSSESVIDANPDIILTNVNYIENPIDEIMSRDGWENITAVKDKAVYSIDTNSSSRPTPNAIKVLKEMAKAIYPDEYADK